MDTMFSLSEEAFLLRSLKEVVLFWSRGSGQASFNLTVKDGKGDLQLGFQLGSPSDAHLSPDQFVLHPHHHGPQQEQDLPTFRRPKCPSRRKRDRNRAAKHQAQVCTGTAAAGGFKQAAAATAVKLPFQGKILPIKLEENSGPVAPVAAPAKPTSATKSPDSSFPTNTPLAPPIKAPNPAGPPKIDVDSVKKSLFPAGLPHGRPPSSSSATRDYKQKEKELWSKLFKA